MENFIENLQDFTEILNPTIVDFNNSTQRNEFIFSWIGIILVILVTGIIFRNRKNIFRFLINTYNELKLVEWLSKDKTYRYSVITVLALIFGAAFIFLVDQAFLLLRNLIILRGN